MSNSSPMKTRAQIAALTVAIVAFATIGTMSAAGWVDRTFPGFLVLDNGVVASVGLPGWPATSDGEIFQRRITHIDGAAVDWDADVLHHVGSQAEGTPVVIGLRSGAGAMDLEVSVERFAFRDVLLIFGAYLVNGLLLGGVALLALSRSRSHEGVRAAIPFLVCASFWGLTGMGLYSGHLALFRLHALFETFLFAAALHLALEFPSALIRPSRSRQIVAAGYAAAIALALAYQVLLFEPASYVRVHLLTTSLGGAALLAVVAGLVFRYVRSQRHELHATLRVLTAGACLALLLPVALTLPEIVTGGSAPQNLVAWTVFVFPLTIGYAIGRDGAIGARPTVR